MSLRDEDPPAYRLLPSHGAIAATFVALLKVELGPGQFAEVVARNAAETNEDICHSHDFCDANMVMDAAMKASGIDPEEVWGRDFAGNQEAADYWNACWKAAMPLMGGRLPDARSMG